MKGNSKLKKFTLETIVFVNEGQYSNDVDDKGGRTIWGISAPLSKKTGYPEGARHSADIIIEEFYYGQSLDRIPDEKLALYTLDFSVTSGVNAIKVLQDVLDVKQTGVINDITIESIKRYKGDLLTDYAFARIGYYYSLKNPKYFRGWRNRSIRTRKVVLAL